MVDVNPNVVIDNTSGIATHGNDLSAEPGSTSVADNVTFGRERLPEARRGFKDFSSNLPDFAPSQLIVGSNGADRYLHLDSGLWYYDTTSTKWLRKRGSLGSKSTSLNGVCYYGGHLYYVTDNHVIYDVNMSTGTRSILAGRFGVSGTANGTGDAARFNLPVGICTDGTNLYVTDNANFTIRKVVISSKSVTTLAGAAGSSGTTDNTGAAARFDFPGGICTDGTNLYVAETHQFTIRKIVISSAVVTTFAGSAGVQGSTDASGSSARFGGPFGICYDGSANLYVTDYTKNTIRKIVISSAAVTTIAGTYGTAGSHDATGLSATFSSPSDVTIVGGNLYVADYAGYIIRKIAPSTAAVTTIAGVANTPGSTDGFGTAALFDFPQCLANDGTDLYIAEFGGKTIRKMYLATSYVFRLFGDYAISAAATGNGFADGLIAGPP